jgi:hypothetical protein
MLIKHVLSGEVFEKFSIFPDNMHIEIGDTKRPVFLLNSERQYLKPGLKQVRKV